MSIFTLLYSELKFRLLTSTMAMVSFLVATACVVAAMVLLDGYDTVTNNQIHDLKESSMKQMDALENEARVFSKSLGFNIFVYNRMQDLGRFYSNDTSDHFLTLKQAETLAASRFALLNHHLPVLRSRYTWDSYGGDIIIGGIKGEIYIKSDKQKPLEVRIEPNQVHLGYSLHTRLKVSKGDTISIGGKSYTVTQTRTKLGSKDDIVMFMNLGDAQTLLGLPGKISGILALSCNCAAGDIEPIRQGVRQLIPQADVVEFAVRAKARADARRAAKDTRRAAIAEIESKRGEMRSTLKRFSLFFTSFMVVASAILLVFLFGNNVKERRSEIAILRTLGIGTSTIYLLFFGKALLLALAGSCIGVCMGCWLGLTLSEIGGMEYGAYIPLALQVVAASCAISLLASWMPARLAARQDPGMVLNEG